MRQRVRPTSDIQPLLTLIQFSAIALSSTSVTLRTTRNGRTSFKRASGIISEKPTTVLTASTRPANVALIGARRDMDRVS